MLAALLKLVPFRDYAYAAAALSAVVWYNVHVHNLELAAVKHEQAAVQVESNKVQANAQAQIVALNKDYDERAAQTEETYEGMLQTADAQHASDLERVRQLTATAGGNSGPVLQGTGSANAEADGGPSRASVLGAAASLADALRRDDDALSACYADRDALTGK